MALVVGVKVLEQVVVAAKELAQSPWVAKLREVGTSPVSAVLLRVNA
jgi:hypothetical protein